MKNMYELYEDLDKFDQNGTINMQVSQLKSIVEEILTLKRDISMSKQDKENEPAQQLLINIDQAANTLRGIIGDPFCTINVELRNGSVIKILGKKEI